MVGTMVFFVCSTLVSGVVWLGPWLVVWCGWDHGLLCVVLHWLVVWCGWDHDLIDCMI